MVKTIIGLIVVGLLLASCLYFTGRSPENAATSPPAVSKRQEPRPPVKPVPLPELRARVEPSEEMAPDQAGLEKLSRDKVEAYLTRNNRKAPSLLAALHALDDTNYLNEAIAKFPDDPQVQWTVLARDAAPQERRKWLDLFKASSPNNSLANYLSAADYFKSGQSERAIKELLEAADKKEFKDYAMEGRLNEEELSRATGRTPLESIHVAGWANDVLPELARFKELAAGIGAARKEYLDAGDSASASDLVQAQLTLAGRLHTGEAGKLMINQLVGLAIEAMTLKQLDPNTPYEFLAGKTPAQRSEELKRERESVREATKSFTAAYSTLTEAELVSFSDRVKIYGEAEAARWLQQRAGTNSPGRSP